jgi:lipopolysaccharide export system protein LptA
MSKRFFIRGGCLIQAFFVPALFLMLLAAPVKADDSKTGDTKPQDTQTEESVMTSKGPITVTSRTLSADQKSRQALFEGDVIARNEAMTMCSDRMLVKYGEKGGVEHMTSEGSVKLIKGGRVITAGKAEYFRDGDKIIFSINPKVVEGKTVITGTIIVYHLNDERTEVSESKVLIDNESK